MCVGVEVIALCARQVYLRVSLGLYCDCEQGRPGDTATRSRRPMDDDSNMQLQTDLLDAEGSFSRRPDVRGCVVAVCVSSHAGRPGGRVVWRVYAAEMCVMT